jgi:hypothetical protein
MQYKHEVTELTTTTTQADQEKDGQINIRDEETSQLLLLLISSLHN